MHVNSPPDPPSIFPFNSSPSLCGICLNNKARSIFLFNYNRQFANYPAGAIDGTKNLPAWNKGTREEDLINTVPAAGWKVLECSVPSLGTAFPPPQWKCRSQHFPEKNLWLRENLKSGQIETGLSTWVLFRFETRTCNLLQLTCEVSIETAWVSMSRTWLYPGDLWLDCHHKLVIV